MISVVDRSAVQRFDRGAINDFPTGRRTVERFGRGGVIVHRSSWIRFGGLVPLSIVAAALAFGGEDAKPTRAAAPADRPKSLDDLLMDDLDNELLDGLDAIPSKTDRNTTGGDRESASDLDRQLLRQLGEGEDLGEEASNPLVSISRRMRAVEGLMGQRNTSGQTQRLQKEIVADLDVLIEQLKKQCSSGQCAGGGKKKPKGKPGSSSKAGTGENQGNNRPAKDSTARTGISEDSRAELDRMREMLNAVWGHLPAKVRDQLQSSAPEEFLPKYEKLIEEYYKRLAEERR